VSAPQLHTPTEAARILKVPESWLRKKAAARVIPCTFVGKHLRFSDGDITEIVQAGARHPASRTQRSPHGRRASRPYRQER
jgi:excisionase family DNA binding protein